jgi:hypothetical protein
MKKIALINLLWFMSLSLAIAQSSVLDYYFPTEKTIVMLTPKDTNREILMKYSFTRNNSTGGLILDMEYQGEIVSKLLQKLQLSANKIQVKEEITNSFMGKTHKSYDESQKILLILPKVGDIAKWKHVEEDGTVLFYEAKLVTLSVHMDGGTKNLDAIKVKRTSTSKSLSSAKYQYWAKRLGLLFELVDSEVYQYQAGVGLRSVQFSEKQK